MGDFGFGVVITALTLLIAAMCFKFGWDAGFDSVEICDCKYGCRECNDYKDERRKKEEAFRGR